MTFLLEKRPKENADKNDAEKAQRHDAEMLNPAQVFEDVLNHRRQEIGNRRQELGAWLWTRDFGHSIGRNGGRRHRFDVGAETLQVGDYRDDFPVRRRIGDRAEREIENDLFLLRLDAL